MKLLKYLTLPVCMMFMVFPMKSSAQGHTENTMETTRSKDGTLIAFKRSGEGPPLVLVHGATADHTRWNPVLPALEQKFTVYAVDRRGRGSSEDSDEYSIEREYEDIAAVVDAIGGEVNLLGHSFGGICALEAALLTTNIRRLVLYEPAPPGYKERPDTIALMQTLLDSGDREGVLRTFFLEIAGVTPDELDIMQSLPAWEGRVGAAHTILRELKSIESLPPFDATKFKTMETPTLLLQGGNSIAIYGETIELIHSMLPNSRIVVLPGQQHVAMNTAPALFVEEVIRFLTEQFAEAE